MLNERSKLGAEDIWREKKISENLSKFELDFNSKWHSTMAGRRLRDRDKWEKGRHEHSNFSACFAVEFLEGEWKFTNWKIAQVDTTNICARRQQIVSRSVWFSYLNCEFYEFSAVLATGLRYVILIFVPRRLWKFDCRSVAVNTTIIWAWICRVCFQIVKFLVLLSHHTKLGKIFQCDNSVCSMC